MPRAAGPAKSAVVPTDQFKNYLDLRRSSGESHKHFSRLDPAAFEAQLQIKEREQDKASTRTPSELGQVVVKLQEPVRPGAPSTPEKHQVVSPKTQKKKANAQRRQRNLEDLSSALSKIWRRGGDVWDADEWLETKEEFIESGNWDGVRGLVSVVGRATNEAIRSGKYYLPPPDGQVALKDIASGNPVTQWHGMSNVTPPEFGADCAPPPLICTTQAPLDTVQYLKEHFESRPICFSVEVTDFSSDGEKLCGLDARNQTQQELFLRTDFQNFAERATKQVSSGHASMNKHLTATKDPYVFAARDVTIFRGPAEEGYSFVTDPLQFDVIVSARSCERPNILKCKEGPENARVEVRDSRGEPVEFFADQEVFTSLLERLNLVGLVALNAAGGDKKPVLVLSATNLRLQPRHGIARALKHWRMSYGAFFEAIVVACGDDKVTAELFDETINSDIYTAGSPMRHCDDALLELSVNPDLADFNPEEEEEETVVAKVGGRRFSIHDNLGAAMTEISESCNAPPISPPSKGRKGSETGSKDTSGTTSTSASDGPYLTAGYSNDKPVLPISSPTGASQRTGSKETACSGFSMDSDDDDAQSNSDNSAEQSKAACKKDVGALPALDTRGGDSHRCGTANGSRAGCQSSLLDEVQSLALSVHSRLDQRRNSKQGIAAMQGRRRSAHVVPCFRDNPLHPSMKDGFGRRRSL